MANTHRAIIEWAEPPRIEFIAAGDAAFCGKALLEYLEARPETLRPYERWRRIDGKDVCRACQAASLLHELVVRS